MRRPAGSLPPPPRPAGTLPPPPASRVVTSTAEAGGDVTSTTGQQGRYLHHRGRGLLRHVVDGILVPQPVGALHSVVEVPPPVVLLHVPQGGVDPSLKRQQPCELQQARLPTASRPQPDSEKASCSWETVSERSHRPADSEGHLLPLRPRDRAQLWIPQPQAPHP